MGYTPTDEVILRRANGEDLFVSYTGQIISTSNYSNKHFTLNSRIEMLVSYINDLISELETAKKKNKKAIEKRIYDLKYELLCLEQPEIIKEIDEIFTS